MVNHIKQRHSNSTDRLGWPGFAVAITLLTLVFSLQPSRAFSQAVSGSITGAVLDPTGKAIPGAAVKAVNSATGIEYATRTTEAGYYTISNLIAGQYKVVVAVTGFEAYEQSRVEVRIGAVTRLDLGLKIGDLAESVTVTAAAPQL